MTYPGDLALPRSSSNQAIEPLKESQVALSSACLLVRGEGLVHPQSGNLYKEEQEVDLGLGCLGPLKGPKYLFILVTCLCNI